MKNLHLMPMNSTFDDDTVLELTELFPDCENLFFHRVQRPALKDFPNSIVMPEAFHVEYINSHHGEYDQIFLHSLFLSPGELLALDDEAARKITWCVWGHDLYTTKKKQPFDPVHTVKKLLRGTYLKQYRNQRAVARKVGSFRRIAINYSYDEHMIRQKYGHRVPVVYGPYFSRTTEQNIDRLRALRLARRDPTVNILIGHCGFPFLEHEKYLDLLSAYKDEDLHIHMVLSYGADEARIARLREQAFSIFGPEKCTIQTEMMPKVRYYEYLTNMDVAIFPFRHQSALGNVIRMAYMGVKLYFDPRGVLAKGFLEGGVPTGDCRKIGSIPFGQLYGDYSPPDIHAPLFNTFSYRKNIAAWADILDTKPGICHE